MHSLYSPQGALLAAALLFCIGVYGVLARRNVLVVLMSLELMLNAVNVALVAFGRAFIRNAADGAGTHTGQIFTLMVLAVAAAEAAVGLSILLLVYRRWRTIDVAEVSELSG